MNTRVGTNEGLLSIFEHTRLGIDEGRERKVEKKGKKYKKQKESVGFLSQFCRFDWKKKADPFGWISLKFWSEYNTTIPGNQRK
jgi:hypothetical protein